MASNRGVWSWLGILLALAHLLLQPSIATAQAPEFVLRETCPPSFKLSAEGVCSLRSQYQFYTSNQNRGVGGTRTGLPPHRDGFTPSQIDLGRYLFFDPLLSADGSKSCAACHQPERGFSDGLPRSEGIQGQTAPRAAPTLWNVTFLHSLFWDARADTLEEQAQASLYSPLEMGNSPAGLLGALRDNAWYPRLFRQAFPPHRGEQLSLPQVYTSLAAFQSSLISLNSRYDRYAHGYHAALTGPEIEGLNVFRSFVARCAECHTPPLFTNQQVAVIGAPEPEGLPLDIGVEQTWQAQQMKAGFKVPTLRNIALTAPYMHSGSFNSLGEVLEFYNGGRGHALPAGVELQLHWHIVSPRLSEYELARLADFLQTLTDESLKPQVPERLPSGLTKPGKP